MLSCCSSLSLGICFYSSSNWIPSLFSRREYPSFSDMNIPFVGKTILLYCKLIHEHPGVTTHLLWIFLANICSQSENTLGWIEEVRFCICKAEVQPFEPMIEPASVKKESLSEVRSEQPANRFYPPLSMTSSYRGINLALGYGYTYKNVQSLE